MNTNDYLDLLGQRFKNHFTIEKNAYITDKSIDLFAKCNLVLGRTLISKSDIIDKYESNEYIVVKAYNKVSEEDILDFLEYSRTLPCALVHPHKEHRNSYINAVMVCSCIKNKAAAAYFSKFKYSKIYKFYLHGFCEIRVFLVDLSDSTVSANRAGKQLKKVYLPAP